MELPVLWPFTYLDRAALDFVYAGLGKFEVLQLADQLVPETVKQASAQDKVAIRPVRGLDGRRLGSLLEDYLNWADLLGPDSSSLALFYRQSRGLPPLVDENAPSRIRDQVRHLAASGPGSAPEPDPVLQAGLVLAMAQFYDQQQDELDRQMEDIAALERSLFSSLRGDSEVGPGGPSLPGRPDDPGRFKTERRLTAWAQLASLCPDLGPFWVTTSRAVMECMQEMTPIRPLASVALEGRIEPSVWRPFADGQTQGADGQDGKLELDDIAGPALVLFSLPQPGGQFPLDRLKQQGAGWRSSRLLLGWIKG